MVNFGKKTIIYFLLIVVILLLLDIFVFPQNNNILSFKKKLIQKEKKQLVIMGNSHTFFGLNPSLFSSEAINIASKGRKLETDFFILKNNIDSFTGKTIILPISFYTMFSNNFDKNERLLYYNFFSVKEYNKGFVNNSLLINTSFKELLDDAILSKVFLKLSRDGWRANKETYLYDKVITKERIGNVEERLSNKYVFNINKKYLNEFIDLCNINNIKLIILLPPYHPDFYRYSENKYYKENISLIKDIKQKYKDVIFVDSKKLNISLDNYFENIDHLNEKGAEVFSKKIDSIINRNKY